MLPLDPDDARPPYAQVADALRREIEQGVLKPGVKLPTHQQLAARYGVSVGTVKRALGDLQGAGLIVSRQGQGAYVRTRQSLLESVPPAFSAYALDGLWVTTYQFHLEHRILHHADITHLIPRSSRRITATNYPPDPRTQDNVPPFRNDIEAQLASRHLIGHWRNTSDTRYFGSLHLAVLPGENVIEGYYTGLTTDIKVDAMPWKWVRLNPASLPETGLTQVTLKNPQEIYALLYDSTYDAPLDLTAVVESN